MRLEQDCAVQLGLAQIVEYDAWVQNNRVNPHLQLRSQLAEDGRLLPISRSKVERSLDRDDQTQPRQARERIPADQPLRRVVVPRPQGQHVEEHPAHAAPAWQGL